ncbi:MAG TPA: hypothetical protein PL037_09310, partial [Elusimicrobiales bacterium]|nr:hypothetical protein [Elusimicrobiales bacterium]
MVGWIYGLQDGNFYLKAFKDVNNNGVQDSFEPYGVYGGTSAAQFQVSGGVTSASLAITLAEPAVGSVSGYLTYSEGRSGNIRIEAARPSATSNDLSVVGFSTVARSGGENVSQAYSIGLLAPATNYTIRAFVDENGNNFKDVMEPFASVASSVTASTDTAGVNLNIRNPGTGAVGNSSLSGYISYTPIPGQGYVSTGSVWVGWAGDENFDNIFYAQTISTFTWDAVSSTWAYSRSGVLGGTSYYMAAFLDMNSNGQPDEDSGEPIGFYSVGGQMAPLYVPASSAVVRDVFMVSPSTGYISGVVHYYGAMTGSAMVQAWNRACDNEGGNKNCSSRSYFNVVSTSVADYPFTLRFLDPTTSYQMSAVMDLNGNRMTDPGEPSAFLPSYMVTGTTAAVLT